jgi:hypothetical protein
MGTFEEYFKERIKEAEEKIERQKQYIQGYRDNLILLKDEPEYFECNIDSSTCILVYAHKLEKLGEYLEIRGTILQNNNGNKELKSYLKIFMCRMQNITPLTEERYKDRLYYHMTQLWKQ